MKYMNKDLEKLRKEDLVTVIALLYKGEDGLEVSFKYNAEKINKICESCLFEYGNNVEIPYIEDVQI